MCLPAAKNKTGPVSRKTGASAQGSAGFASANVAMLSQKFPQLYKQALGSGGTNPHPYQEIHFDQRAEMAEIALLEVEEFERRRKWAKEDGLEEINRSMWYALVTAKKKIGEHVSSSIQKMEFARRAMQQQPRSPLGLAASDGFFSA